MLCRIPWQIFSVILHLFPSILLHSPSVSVHSLLFSCAILSPPVVCHIPLFRHTRSFRHIPSHPVISVAFYLPSVLPFILSHPFIFPYWDPTVSSSDLNLYSGSILVSATTPIIPTLSCSGLLLYSYFYCSMIRSVLIVPFRIYSDKL